MTRALRRPLAVGALTCALLIPLSTATADPTPDLRDANEHVSRVPLDTARFATTGKWFVQLSGSPTSAGGKDATIARGQSQFESTVKRRGVEVSVTKRYKTLFNGVTVTGDADAAAAVADLPGVEAVYPVVPVALPKPQKVSPKLYSAVAMTGADKVRTQLGFTGKGVRVGIIDSGVDYDHPDLGGTGTDGGAFPTARVTHGYDFVGDDYNADPVSPDYQPVARPDAVPDDCQGHGTHVAGIVGANGTGKGSVVGVAPGVTLGAYRVFGCEGSTDTQVILDAMERALADKMDVVNMSLGAAFQAWPQYPTSVAADRLAAAGVVVVAAAGNEGDYFTQALDSPSVGKRTISVASYDNTKVMLDELVVTDDPAQEPVRAGYTDATGSPKAGQALNGLPVVRTTDPLGCAVEKTSLKGKVAVVSRGTCSFRDKALAAQRAGAAGLIIANNQLGFLSPTVEGETPITIPVVLVSQAQGAKILATTNDDATVPTVGITGQQTSEPNPTGGLVSDFSSWGLAADLSLKPDLGAPGGSIYSTVPLEGGGHASNSGTSMATPHVAGLAALMLQANPALTPDQVRTRLQNTATPTKFSYDPDLGVLDAAHHQGAGLAQVDRAITTQQTVTPGSISAGESADGPHTQKLTVTNSAATPVTYTLKAESAISTYVDPEDPAATQNDAMFDVFAPKVAFSAPTITVPASGSATVNVTIQPAADAVRGATYSGFVHLLPAEGGNAISVPWAGLVGDYGALKVFPDLGEALPALVRVTTCRAWEQQQCVDDEPAFAPVKPKHVYAMKTDLPTVALHLAWPVLKLEVEALSVNHDGKVIASSARPAYSVDHQGRDAGISLWSWDGTVKNANGLRVPVDKGSYVLRFTAHEADGDGGTQVWTSPAFGVGRLTPPVLVAPYEVPGFHLINGRQWRTACEPYSATIRCRTEIWSKQVLYVQGKFVVKQGWFFNNLTYLPYMTRQQWGTNPLARTGAWTANGRKYKTECGTAVTGANACRSYIRAMTVHATPIAPGKYRYKLVEQWVLNNIVRFAQ